MFRKVKRYLQDPYFALGYDMIKKYPHLMSDKFYLSVLWKMKMGYELDWENPKTFNEKLQWLKLYDRKPEYTLLADKYRVKQWVADRIGKQYVIPTLAVYNSVEEIDLDRLPNQFVLKCNHDSGSVFICKDKSVFNLDETKKRINSALKKDFFWEAREWPYKHIERRVFVEPYLEDNASHELPDYKFFAFNGETKVLFIATNRQDQLKETRFDFFDMEFNHLPVTNGHPNADVIPKKPSCFEEMRSLSNILSKGIPQVRCDFYEVNNRVYLGEMTLYHWGGMTPFHPKAFDLKMGEWVSLPYKR